MYKFISIFLLLSVIVYSQSHSLYSYRITDTVVIKSIRADNTTPITQDNISLEKIEFNNYGQELPFLLNTNTSITTYSDAGNYFGYSYMRLRGIDQTRLNVTLDGVPLNEPEDQGVYFNNFVDFTNSIESIQIQRGVGTSTNGMASFGGSINFKSKSIVNPITEFQFSYGSYNTHRFSIEYGTGMIDNFAIYGRYSDANSDGYRYNSMNKSKSFYLSGGLFYTSDMITFTSFYGKQQNQMAYLATSIDDIKIDPKINYLSKDEWDDFKYMFNSVSYTKIASNNITVNMTLYDILLNGDYDLKVQTDMLNYKLKSNYLGYIFNFNYIKDSFDATFGLHLYTYTRTHSFDLQPKYSNNGEKNELSYFIKLKHHINNITLFADVQCRNVIFKYNPDLTYNIVVNPVIWSFFNPKIGITFNFDNITYYASIGMTEREPSRLDMLAGHDDIDISNVNEIGDLTKIKPEKVINFENGLTYKNDNISATLVGFVMKFQNEIAPIGQLSAVYGLPLRKNVADSYRMGLELNVDYNLFTNTVISFNGNYIKSNIDYYKTEKNGLEYNNVTHLLTPKYTVNASIMQNFNKFNLFAETKYSSESYLNNENTVTMPEYILVNCGVNINLYNCTLSIVANNIFDTLYYTSGYTDDSRVPYYYVQAKFNLMTTLKVRL